MTYALVMGSLALSVLFTLSWAVLRGLRWLVGLLPGRSRKSVRPSRKASKPAKRSAAARSSSKPKPKPKPKQSSSPWALTRWLAAWQAALPLAVVSTLIYLVVRLAAHGMSFRPPHALPGGFHSLLAGLGWLSAGLLLLALVAHLARWRCRRAG